MTALPLRGRLYVACVTLAGAVALAFGLGQADFLNQPGLFTALIALASVTAAFDLTLPFTASGSAMSVAYAVDFASLLLLGPHQAMLVAAASALAAARLNQKKAPQPLRDTLFGMAVMVLTVQSAGLALGWLSEPGATATLATIGRPLLATATVYSLVSTGLVATALALSSNASIAATWKAGVIDCAPGSFVGACTAAIASALVTKTGYWIMPLGFAPIYLTYRTYKVYRGRIEDEQRHVQQTSDLHLATIEALARAIDAKDQNTQTHIRRVQTYAARMAKAVGLSTSEIQCVKTAALLHDIGKLAVPEHILSKPGPLTQEEFQKIRIHPEVGAEIIAAVPFPYPVAPIILSHHERWDGKGYPQGLKGEQIPIGARILTIVDYFDAITTERPYHKALPQESAVGLLRHESGLALDPTLVRVFTELLPTLVAEDDAQSEAIQAANAQALEGQSAPAEGIASAAASNNAFENIALAHREIYALYEIAQSMGTSLGVADTMALISSKLINIIPWSGSALFLMNGTDSLKCRFASGTDASQLLNATLTVGEGLSGWVAKNRRTLVNADPRVTFELVGLPEPRLKSALVCPLYVNDTTFIGCLALYHLERQPVHGRSPAPARARRRTGRARHPQLDRVRADAGRLADRSADGPAEPPLDVRAPVARTGARRAPQAPGGAHRHGPRRVQDDQRHLRPPRRRPRAARDVAGAPGHAAPVRPLRPLRRRRVHRRAHGLLAGGGRTQAPRAAGARSARSRSRSGRASGCAWRRAPAPRCSRTTARPTRRCSPKPITGCTATRPRGAVRCRHAEPSAPNSPRPSPRHLRSSRLQAQISRSQHAQQSQSPVSSRQSSDLRTADSSTVDC